ALSGDGRGSCLAAGILSVSRSACSCGLFSGFPLCQPDLAGAGWGGAATAGGGAGDGGAGGGAPTTTPALGFSSSNRPLAWRLGEGGCGSSSAWIGLLSSIFSGGPACKIGCTMRFRR